MLARLVAWLQCLVDALLKRSNDPTTVITQPLSLFLPSAIRHSSLHPNQSTSQAHSERRRITLFIEECSAVRCGCFFSSLSSRFPSPTESLSSSHCRQWRMASGTWFGETSRQSQAEPVKQQQTEISPNHVPEAVPHCLTVYQLFSMLHKVKCIA